MTNSTEGVLSAPIVWAQRADRVFLSIQLEEVTEEQISVDDKKLCFSGKSRGNTYEANLEFNNSIIPEESKQRRGGREYFFELKKKDPGPFWPRLLKDTVKPKNIKVDFNRWKDEDDTDDEEGGSAYDDASLEDMMQQMGTGGAGDSFDPGDVPDSDSDDEDIPNLEPSKE